MIFDIRFWISDFKSENFESPGRKTRRRNRKSMVKFSVVLMFAAFGIIACVRNESGEPKSFVIGESKSYEASLFRANCAICHGKEANGKTIDGNPVPSLRIGEAAKKTEEEIYQQIAHGKLPMPSFENQLTEKEMRSMARFLMRDLQGREVVK